VLILWWLAPPVVATGLAMLWVSWLGRDGRGEVDPEIAARRLGRAISRASRIAPGTAPPQRTRPDERSGGIAVRSSRRRSGRPSTESSTEPSSTRRAS
jgi:hypothetical protein